jgi:hypothetical protein
MCAINEVALLIRLLTELGLGAARVRELRQAVESVGIAPSAVSPAAASAQGHSSSGAATASRSLPRAIAGTALDFYHVSRREGKSSAM